MDQLRDNERDLRDKVARRHLYDANVIDVLTAIYVILKTPVTTSLSDNKYFDVLVVSLRSVPNSRREYWIDTMFNTYASVASISKEDPNLLLLKAYLVFVEPVCASV